jgi:hypothetical protein
VFTYSRPGLPGIAGEAMKLKDIVVGAAIAGSSFLSPEAKGQDTTQAKTEQTQKTNEDTVLLGDFDITAYAEVMKQRGFTIDLEKSGIGVYAGTTVPMLQVISKKTVEGREISVTDYLVHRGGRDFKKGEDGMKYDAGDLETRELMVKSPGGGLEYMMTVDYNEEQKTYGAVSKVIGTGSRFMPNVSSSDATLLLGRVSANPGAFIDAERADIIISRRNVDGYKNTPQP